MLPNYLLNSHVYTHGLVLCPDFTKEAPYCSEQQLIQKLITKQNTENKRRWSSWPRTERGRYIATPSEAQGTHGAQPIGARAYEVYVCRSPPSNPTQAGGISLQVLKGSLFSPHSYLCACPSSAWNSFPAFLSQANSQYMPFKSKYSCSSC